MTNASEFPLEAREERRLPKRPGLGGRGYRLRLTPEATARPRLGLPPAPETSALKNRGCPSEEHEPAAPAETLCDVDPGGWAGTCQVTEGRPRDQGAVEKSIPCVGELPCSGRPANE